MNLCVKIRSPEAERSKASASRYRARPWQKQRVHPRSRGSELRASSPGDAISLRAPNPSPQHPGAAAVELPVLMNTTKSTFTRHLTEKPAEGLHEQERWPLLCEFVYIFEAKQFRVDSDMPLPVISGMSSAALRIIQSVVPALPRAMWPSLECLLNRLCYQ